MPKKKLKTLRCPTCRKLVLVTDQHFPFCSERCRTIDLGKWASGAYVISTPVNDPESGGEAEYTEQRPSSSTRSGPDVSPDDDQHGRNTKPN